MRLHGTTFCWAVTKPLRSWKLPPATKYSYLTSTMKLKTLMKTSFNINNKIRINWAAMACQWKSRCPGNVRANGLRAEGLLASCGVCHFREGGVTSPRERPHVSIKGHWCPSQRGANMGRWNTNFLQGRWETQSVVPDPAPTSCVALGKSIISETHHS